MSEKNVLLDRINLPVIGPFILSWPLYNWRFSIYLFGSNTSDEKVAYFLKHHSIAKVLWFPLLSAIIYTFVLPYFVEVYNGYIDRMKERYKSKRELIATLEDYKRQGVQVSIRFYNFSNILIELKAYENLKKAFDLVKDGQKLDPNNRLLSEIGTVLANSVDETEKSIENRSSFVDVVKRNRNYFETNSLLHLANNVVFNAKAVEKKVSEK